MDDPGRAGRLIIVQAAGRIAIFFLQTRIAIPRCFSQSYGAYFKYIVHVHVHVHTRTVNVCAMLMISYVILKYAPYDWLKYRGMANLVCRKKNRGRISDLLVMGITRMVLLLSSRPMWQLDMDNSTNETTRPSLQLDTCDNSTQAKTMPITTRRQGRRDTPQVEFPKCFAWMISALSWFTADCSKPIFILFLVHPFNFNLCNNFISLANFLPLSLKGQPKPLTPGPCVCVH